MCVIITRVYVYARMCALLFIFKENEWRVFEQAEI